MNKELACQIMDILYTLEEACTELYTFAESRLKKEFKCILQDMENGLRAILYSFSSLKSNGNRMCELACQSALDTLKRVAKLAENEHKNCLKKIEYELLPILKEAYWGFYYFEYLPNFPEDLSNDFETHRKLLCGNTYIDEALQKGKFKYEVSIYVLAYNKLDYTKQCVESLLQNIPNGLNYELILVNHGSNDGTKEYFESILPDKQLDIAVNGGGAGAVARIVEGEFTIMVSNDVIVTHHAIDNLLACIRSDPQIAWAVPTTPNISNFQTISATYQSLAELQSFSDKNNSRNPFRWEQRVRLCNPIDIRRNSVFYASSGLCLNGCFHTIHPTHYRSFPDDRWSLLLRRNGYKMMLVKDAYCHHFGSITLQKEVQQQNNYYQEGRQEFFRAYGVDPWGTGFCYDPVFSDCLVDKNLEHVNILGINCGLGSNSLKMKEQMKEFYHNLNCTLTNLTDDCRFIQDLNGISDETAKIVSRSELKRFLYRRSFHYIVWEEIFLSEYKFYSLLKLCLEHLTPNGKLLIKLTKQSYKTLINNCLSRKDLGNNWVILNRDNLGPALLPKTVWNERNMD